MRWRGVLALVCAAATADAQEFQTFKGHGGPIMALEVSPSGVLASASFDNSIGRWQGDVPTWLERHDAAVTALTFGADGRLCSGGDDFVIWCWDEPALRVGTHKGKVTSLALSPNGQTLASGSWDGDLVLWNLRAGTSTVLPYAGSGINAVAFDTSGEILFAGTSQGRLVRYDLPEETHRTLVSHGFGVNRLVFGDGWLAYGAVDGGTRVVDPLSGAPLQDFTLERRPILALDYHAGTSRLAVGDGHGYISMIDTANWKIVKDFKAMRDGPVWALAFSNDGSVIHAGGLDDVIYAWPVALLDDFEPVLASRRLFLEDAGSLPNGERQFKRKCSICHALRETSSRKAGPTLHRIFGRRAGSLPGYRYSRTLDGSQIVWSDETIDDLFELGPDHYIPGSKMPMQVIAGAQDRADLIEFLRNATEE